MGIYSMVEMSHITNYTVQLIISISPLLLYKLKITRRLPIESLFYSFIVFCTIVTIYRELQGYNIYYFGIDWYGALYYLLSFVMLFRFIRDRFDPMRAVFGSLFTVWTSSIMWEMPSYYIWHLRFNIVSTHFWWNFGLCLLIIPAFLIFNITTSPKKMIIFLVSMIPSTIKSLVCGPSLTWIPDLPSNRKWLELVFLVCRAIVLFGLCQLMWDEKEVRKKVSINNAITGESKKSPARCRGYSPSELSDFWGNEEGERIVLDLGSGPGNWSRFLSNGGHGVIAADINKGIFLLGDYEGVAGLVCDAHHLPFRRNAFDNVFCIEVLEHLREPEKCVKEVSYVLRRRGEFMCSTPCLNIPFFRNFIIKLFRRILNVQKDISKIHLWVFSDNQLFDILRPYFKIARTRYLRQTVILAHWFGINRRDWDERLRFLPFFLLRYSAQGIMILCQKGDE